MTISSTVRIAGPYIGNGTATVFSFAFKVFTATNLQVVRVDTSTGLESTLVLTTDYTVSLNADQDSNPGGNVTLLAVLATGFNMIITSDIANLQPTDLTNQGGFYPEVITDALDRATIQIQQMADELTRSIKIPVTDGLSLDMELPTAAARANSFLAFDATGEPTVVTAGSSGAPTTITRQQFSGTGSQVAYTLASDPGALGNSCEVFVGGIYQQRDTYTIAGTTLTFTAAPVAGTNNIEVVNFLTTAIGTTDSSLVTYVPAGAGATQRTVQAKLRDVVSVKDFGAVGDDVTNDTAAIQAAINAAYALNKSLYIPGGRYRFTNLVFSPTDSVSTGQGLRIYGDSSGNGTLGRGSILSCNAASGDAFTVAPTSGASYLSIDGITFHGNPNVNGLVFNNSWFANINNCVFGGFSNASCKALWFKTNTTYSGSSIVSKCVFQSNSTAILSGGSASGTPSVNDVRYNDCWFLDNTVAAIQIGTNGGAIMQGRCHYITNCDFENNSRDILTYATVYALTISQCNFETQATTSLPRIENAYDGISPVGASIEISGCYFQQTLPSPGDSIVILRGGGLKVIRNHSSYGNQTDRYFLTALDSSRVEAEPNTTPPGVTSYPIRISPGAVGLAKTYVSFVNTGLRPEPLISGATNASVIYQGSGSPNNSLGASGDLYINNDVTGANIESRDSLWQKGASFWKRVTYLQGIDNLSYATVMSPDLAKGSVIQVTPTNNVAFVFDPITNAGPGQVWSLAIINTTGGALGAATFVTASGGYKLAGAWVQPANGFRRIITFYYNPSTLFNYEIARTSTDVPN